MSVEVPDNVLAMADKCEHGCSCLETQKCGEKKMCEVRDADGKNILFLRNKKFASCPYRLHFGYGQICRCPVHYWLHVNRKIQ